MPPTSQSEIRMLLFLFKLRDSAARRSLLSNMDARAHGVKLKEKDQMNAVGNPFNFLFYFSHLNTSH